MKAIIQKQDESLMTKANKGDFFEMRQFKVDNETHEQTKIDTKKMIDETNTEMSKFH